VQNVCQEVEEARQQAYTRGGVRQSACLEEAAVLRCYSELAYAVIGESRVASANAVAARQPHRCLAMLQKVSARSL